MAKWAGLDGTSTANLDLYQAAKTDQGWDTNVPFTKVSFIPTADCYIKVSAGDDIDADPKQIKVLANIGWSEENCRIIKFVVVDTGIDYVLSYRW